MTYDFSGWATKNDLKCSDGRVIRKNAFKANDGQKVPLVWNHQHNEPFNVLGHAVLENRDNGVYAYCTFNDTESGLEAKKLVAHGDVSALSIYANQLKQMGQDVIHGAIREVSLVLAGANPGAFIDSIIAHGDGNEDEAIIYTGDNIVLYHSGDDTKEKEKKDMADATKTADNEKTVADVFNTLTEEQKTVVYAIIGQALEDAGSDDDDDDDDEGEDNNMKHNVFDTNTSPEDVLSHSDMVAILDDGKRRGSLKDSVLAHGIEHIDYLFPDAKNVTPTPTIINRDQSWVAKVMNSTHHTPFSRIKSMHADITGEEARAKGYIKGKKKPEEVFTLLKRTTQPTTIVKLQKIDRDDIVDITDFDVVAWLKSEMRGKLDEEIARAILIGDGRSTSDDNHINEQCIRPIWKDDDLYTIKEKLVFQNTHTESDKAKAFIRAAIKSRKNYKGSGSPVMFTTEDMLTDCLLLEDSTGRIIYDSIAKLATALRVSEIVTVPVMEGVKRNGTEDNKEYSLLGLIVNLSDYNVGADKGGAVNMFDDFDIDYNKQKYLIETRCSGALVTPYSAIAIEASVTAG